MIGHHHEAAEKDAYILSGKDTLLIVQNIEVWKLETERREYCGNWRGQSNVRMKTRVQFTTPCPLKCLPIHRHSYRATLSVRRA
jgi:hypothetical protein